MPRQDTSGPLGVGNAISDLGHGGIWGESVRETDGTVVPTAAGQFGTAEYARILYIRQLQAVRP
jgi:hypothetical protein